MLSVELVVLLLVSSCSSAVSSSTVREVSGRVANDLKPIDKIKNTLRNTECCDLDKAVKLSEVNLDNEAKKPRKFKVYDDLKNNGFKPKRAGRPKDLQGHHQTTKFREVQLPAEANNEKVTFRDASGGAFPVNNVPDPNLPKIRRKRGWIYDQYREEERQREQELRERIIADYEREKAMKREEIYQELRIWGPISAVLLILLIALCVICCMYRPCQKSELRRGRYMSASQL